MAAPTYGKRECSLRIAKYKSLRRGDEKSLHTAWMQAGTSGSHFARFAQRAVCLALALLMHVVLLRAVIHIGAAPEDRNSRAPVQRSARALRVVFVESDSKNRESSIAGLISSALDVTSAVNIQVSAPTIRPLLADSFESSRELITTNDVVEAQRLQKVYVGQISARLRRVLEEVRRTSSLPATCLVNVVQDERGIVLDVLTDQCDADADWQDMVSRAIRQASPLPLPPQGLAMGSYLTLDVSSLLTPFAGAESSP
jgi:hypothetical protein